MSTKAYKNSDSAQSAELRRRAEDRLRASEAQPTEVASVTDARALVHELQVHQIELEIQNEELQRARMEAEEASEKHFDLFDFAPTGLFLWDHDGRILEINLAGTALLGLDRSVANQKRFGQFVAEEFRSTFADFVKRVLATDARQTCEILIEREDSPVWVLVEGIAAQDRRGPERLCRAAVIDITQQKRADELTAANQALEAEIAARKRAGEAVRQSDALRLSNAYNRSLIEASLDPLVTIGSDGKITDVNAATEAATGRTRSELIGTDFCDYFTDPERARAGYEQVFRESSVRDYALELRHRDGRVFSVLYNASVYRDEAGHVMGVFAAARDITERKHAEEQASQLRCDCRIIRRCYPQQDARGPYRQLESRCKQNLRLHGRGSDRQFCIQSDASRSP